MNRRLFALGIVMTFSLACLPGCGAEGDEDDDTVEGEESSESAITKSDFAVPAPLRGADEARLINQYHLGGVTRDVPARLLAEGLAFLDSNRARLPNRDVLTVIDYSKRSGDRRFFIVNLRSRTVSSHVVAHGTGSDPGRTGWAKSFSNTPGSNATSLGFFVTGETYSGKNGTSLRLDGVSPENSAARARAVVVHGAPYVSPGNSIQGRSWGCPAVPMAEKDAVINAIKGGSLIYAAR